MKSLLAAPGQQRKHFGRCDISSSFDLYHKHGHLLDLSLLSSSHHSLKIFKKKKKRKEKNAGHCTYIQPQYSGMNNSFVLKANNIC